MYKGLCEAQCDAAILEQWREVILKQEWKDDIKIKVHSLSDNRILDVNKKEDQEEFLRAVRGPFSKKELELLKTGWPLHRGFGATCDPSVFHLQSVWDIRQDPDHYTIASYMLEDDKLWVGVNRSIQKLPGQGEEEFLHGDFNMLFPASDDGEDEVKQLCGKVGYTSTQFLCVPKSHTREFQQQVVEQYSEHYPHAKPSDKKFGFDLSKPDPMGLVEKSRLLIVPLGVFLFWKDKLIHGQKKTPINKPVEYGQYLGYWVKGKGSRDEYQATCGVCELDDRLRSYNEGVAPLLWPSFDKIQFYPKKFDNFPNIMKAYIEKLDVGHPMVVNGFMKNGKPKQYLIPMPRVNYVPPVLSELGQMLLGIREWPDTNGKRAAVDEADPGSASKKQRKDGKQAAVDEADLGGASKKQRK